MLKLIVVLKFTAWNMIMGTAGMVSIRGLVGRTGKKYSTAEGLSIWDCIYMEQLKVKHSLHSPCGQRGLQPKFTQQFFYYKAKLSVLHSKEAKGFMDGFEWNEWIYFEVVWTHVYVVCFSRLNMLVGNTENRNMLQKALCATVSQRGLQRGQ